MSRSKIFSWNNILIPTMLFVSDDTIMFGTNINAVWLYLKYLILFFIAVKLFTEYSRTLSNRDGVFLISMCIIILLSSLVNRYIILGIFYKIVILFISFFLVKKYTLEQFAFHFNKYIYFIACISLVGSFAALFLRPLLEILPRITNIANVEYYNAVFFTAPVSLAEEFRNAGNFRESGVYQMFLNLALIFQLFVLKNFDKKRLLVLVTALLLTKSTTGYAVFSLILTLFFISNQSSFISKKVKFLVMIMVVAAVGVITVKTDMFSPEGILFGKLQDETNDSRIARLASITSNYEIWKMNPLFGTGLKIDELFVSVTYNRYGFASEHNTNTFLYELACWGMFYFLILIVGIYNFCKKISGRFIDTILIFMIMFLFSVGEKLVFSTFFYALMFYGYSKPHSLKYNRVNISNNVINNTLLIR